MNKLIVFLWINFMLGIIGSTQIITKNPLRFIFFIPFVINVILLIIPENIKKVNEE